MLFRFRQAKFFLTERNALHQKSHIFCQGAHGLQTLQILFRLAWCEAVNAVPILTGRDGHAGDRKEFVEFVKRGGKAAAAGSHNGGADFHRFIEWSAVKQARQKRDKCCVCGGIIHRTSDDKTVRFRKFRCNFVDKIVKNAVPQLRTLLACHTSSDVFVADMNNFRFDTFFVENIHHFMQSNSSIAVRLRASV